jgi:YHS domain-containing protein
MKKHFASIVLLMIFFNAISQEPTPALEKDGKDPVCGMKVKKGTTLVSLHKEKQHGFCSKTCKEKFDKDPAKYVKK